MKRPLIVSFLILLCNINFSISAPSRTKNSETTFVQPLTDDQIKRLTEWTEDDKQNIWELSGQFEGDIVLTPSEPFNGLLNESKRWPNRTIPYIIDDDGVFDEEQKNFIHETLKQYAELTCVTARPKKSSDQDYIRITAYNEGCYSNVGRAGGAQQINFQPNLPGSGCLRVGTILHEFLHALGFYHQQSSAERDDFVTVFWTNIEEGKEHNFNKYDYDTVTNFNVSYDYDSVLHYSAYGFSRNGEKTIQPKDASAEIGQRIGFSEKDIIKLNRMYGCDPKFQRQ